MNASAHDFEHDEADRHITGECRANFRNSRNDNYHINMLFFNAVISIFAICK